MEDAIAHYGKPEIVNTDQGTQYTSAIRTQYLENMGIQISMDGKGRALEESEMILSHARINRSCNFLFSLASCFFIFPFSGVI
jgi:hypothetical protein